MATLPLGDIDVYWERRGEGPRLLFVNGSGASIESAAPLIDAFAGQFDVVEQSGGVAGKVGHRRLGHRQRVRHQLRWDGRPGVRGHVARAD